MTTTTTDVRTDARNLMTWLSLPSVQARYQWAGHRALSLRILLGSMTPDADGLLNVEIDEIKSLVLEEAA